jgi:hypothetical protein
LNGRVQSVNESPEEQTVNNGQRSLSDYS